MKVQRNEPCPCGSGKKYKQCCEIKPKKSQRWAVIAVVVFGFLGVWAVGSRMFQEPDPSLGAPPGKVWSEEHGHWHDAPADVAGGTAQPGSAQPAGQAPPGKVWSEEHGHWHDAPVAAMQPAAAGNVDPRAALEAQLSDSLGVPITGLKKIEQPADMVWSEEHQHYHGADGKEPLDWEPTSEQE